MFLQQISPFLVCRLVIKLFCGCFNDFGEIQFLGPKTQKCIPKICHFLNFHIFSSTGCVSSQNIIIFGLQACYNNAFWKFYKDLKIISSIKLFCGSFNDFGKIPFLGPKMVRYVPKICHFLKFHIFHAAGCVSSPNIPIFGL